MTVCSAVLKRLMRSNYLQVFSRNETFWFWDISSPDFPQNVVIGIHSGAALCELAYYTDFVKQPYSVVLSPLFVLRPRGGATSPTNTCTAICFRSETVARSSSAGSSSTLTDVGVQVALLTSSRPSCDSWSREVVLPRSNE